jgi:predicted dehydrogenase
MRQVNIGVIGTGGISGGHFKAYAKLPNVRLVGVADIVPERAKAAAEQWGAERWFTDYNELLALPGLDGVSICTYNQAHREPTVAALKAGVNVLLEKPMSAKLEDSVAMVRAARETGKILQVGFWPRFGHEQQTARRIVQEGTLGEVYYAQMIGGGRRRIPGGSFLKKATAGSGTIADIGCYDLDAFLFIMGHPKPLSVSATVSYRLGRNLPNVPGDWGHNPADVEVEDFGSAFIRFEGGVVLHFVSYWAAHAATLGPSVILGTKAGLQLRPQLTLFRDEFGVMTDVTPVHLPPIDGFTGEVTAFVKAIAEGKPSPVDPEGVLLIDVIVDGIYRSAAEGREVKLEIPL